jgi:hypothetical protein
MAATDPGTDAARQEVLRARDELLEEVVQLGASARAAVDIPARVRRDPVKTAAAVGAASFLVVGGPKRVFRGLKRVVRGPAPAYPKSMLPEEIERVVRSLGEDGDKVRGALERDFAAYATAKRRTDRSFLRNAVFAGFVLPVGNQVTRAVMNLLLQPDREGFAEWLGKVRARLMPEPPGDGGADDATG